MTWRQILEGLAALPAELRAIKRAGSVSVASLKPDDVICVESDSNLSMAERKRIAEQVKLIWPNNRVVVWDSGLRMRVLSGGESEQQRGVH